MYLRFVTQFINENDEIENGIFNAARHIREHQSTQNGDVAKLTELNNWFNAYLKKPTKFSNAANKNPASISLSWFKDSAKFDLLKMQELIDILEKYDLVVER